MILPLTTHIARAFRSSCLILFGMALGASIGIASAQNKQISALDSILHTAEPVYCVRATGGLE